MVHQSWAEHLYLHGLILPCGSLLLSGWRGQHKISDLVLSVAHHYIAYCAVWVVLFDVGENSVGRAPGEDSPCRKWNRCSRTISISVTSPATLDSYVDTGAISL